MIQTINDTEEFMKDGNDSIYIYGAGNCGKWAGRFMQKCGIAFEAFIDKAAVRDCFLYGKKVIHPRNLPLATGKSRIKVIVANAKPWDTIADLHYYADKCNILCLIPVYGNVSVCGGGGGRLLMSIKCWDIFAGNCLQRKYRPLLPIVAPRLLYIVRWVHKEYLRQST